MQIRSIAYYSLFALLLSACEDKQAAEIKAETEANLTALVARGSLSHGEVKVDAEGDGYRVEIDGLVVKPAPDLDLHLGTVRYLHTPIDEELIRYEDTQIASPIALRSPDGTDVGTATVDIERIEGSFYKPSLSFVALDMLLNSVEIESPNEPTFQFDNVQTMIATEDPRAARTNQTGRLSFDALRILGATGERTELGGFRIESKFSDVDLAGWAAASNVLDGAAEDGADIGTAIILMIDSIGSAQGTFALDRIVQSDAAGAEIFSLDGTQVAFGVTDVDKDAGGLYFSVGYQSLALSDTAFAEDPTAELLAPLSMMLNLDLRNVPFRGVAATMMAMAPSISQAGEGQADLMALMVLSTLQTALSSAETELDLSGTQFVLRDARLALDGTVDIDPEAMFGAVANLDLAITGLDGLTERAMALPAGPETEQLQASLLYLATLSERNLEGGEPVDRYKVILTPTGDIQVNGQPVF
jgi:hypothetical protein